MKCGVARNRDHRDGRPALERGDGHMLAGLGGLPSSGSGAAPARRIANAVMMLAAAKVQRRPCPECQEAFEWR